MIIRCPRCTTDFNLPDGKIAGRGVKLRCSKCEHVFRVRLAAGGGDVEIFYKTDQERLSGNPVDGQAGPVLPRSSVTGPTRSRQRTAPSNPFGGGLSPKKQGLFGGSGGASASKSWEDELNPMASGGFEEEDPFGDAFVPGGAAKPGYDDDDPHTQEALLLAPINDVIREIDQEYASKEVPKPKLVDPSQVSFASASAEFGSEGGVSVGDEQSLGSMAMAFDDEEEASDGLDPFWTGQHHSEFGPADELVDPSFGEDAAYFDPEHGIVEASQPEEVKAPSPAASAPAAASTASQTESGQARAARAQAERAGGPEWDPKVLEPHRIGGSGATKVLSLLLIVILVALGFAGYVASQAGGVLDLQRFDHMLQVAFEGKSFEPRAEWLPKVEGQPKALPYEPLQLHSFQLDVLELGRTEEAPAPKKRRRKSRRKRKKEEQPAILPKVVVLRGELKNYSEVPQKGVELRGLAVDGTGRVLEERKVFLGERKSLGDLAKAKDLDAALAELPKSSEVIEAKRNAPFTFVFSEAVDPFGSGQEIAFRVEVSSKKPGDEAKAKEGSKEKPESP